MALRCQVDDAIDVLILHQLIEGIEVADIHLHELVVGLVLNVREVGEITCVRLLVEVDDVILWIFIHEKAYNMRADEASTSCDDNISFHLVCCIRLLTHFSSESTQ